MKALLIIIVIAVMAAALFYPFQAEAGLKKFSSEEELKSYLVSSSEEALGMYYSAGSFGAARTLSSEQMVDTGAPVAGGEEATKSTDYSTTNIQVAGVDEADIVKNDGKYIYTITGNSVVILDAYPAEDANIVSEIEFDSNPSQIFVNNDRLAVFESGYGGYDYVVGRGMEPVELEVVEASETQEGESGMTEELLTEEMIAPYYDYPSTFIHVYDISDRSNPVLIKNFTMDGNYYNSRMIGDYIYLITNHPVYNFEDPVIPRVAYCGGGCIDVWYFDVPESNHQFTIIGALNIQNPDEINTEVFLMGYTQNMYVSQDNIYVTYTKHLRITDFLDKIVDAVLPLVPVDVAANINQIQASPLFSNSEKMSAIGRVLQEYMARLSAEEQLNFQNAVEEKMQTVTEELAKEMEKTIIHKISIGDGNIEYKMQGEVPGNVLNQFSMDEYGGYFRIATTTDTWNTVSKNHVYILDSDLSIVGKVEDLASGERIYSVRFIGYKGYVVTFRQIDPLFVIDLNPAGPEVLGYLKIPGVSDYLHPYDETHLIGVGRDATEEGRISGMKLSLFDVSNVDNPEEISKYIIGERGTDSDALRDHKAFLFSKEKNLLVIPVRLSEGGKWNAWQGAYVFNLDLANGFELKGRVTHTNLTGEDEWYYYDYQSQIKRSLYIDDTLYTVSQKMVKMNDLSDLEEINKIEISS